MEFTSLLLLLIAVYGVAGTYNVNKCQDITYGFECILDIVNNGPYGNDIQVVHLVVQEYEQGIVRVKMEDNENQRWEVPYVLQPLQKEAHSVLTVTHTNQPFSFAVHRDGEVLFNLTSFVFEDQYIELTTSLPTDPTIYGLGERAYTLKLKPDGEPYVIWARDNGGVPERRGLYGTHPVYYDMRAPGKMHGVFWLNSNAQQILLDQGKMKWMSVGGVVDLFFFPGPTPTACTSQYTSIVGRSMMPPAWAMGWHQCRWGYYDTQDLVDVVEGYAKYDIPLDVMWSDIDWMHMFEDYELSPVFAGDPPPSTLLPFVEKLHVSGMKYVMILDPGIHIRKGYDVYEEALEQDLFIKDVQTGEPLVGMVWPGLVHFPDFNLNRTFTWWSKNIEALYTSVGVDGLWIDMNGSCPPTKKVAAVENGFDPNNPPFLPTYPTELDENTMRMDAELSIGINYNVHGLYGFKEAEATYNALKEARKERPFVLTRSTFAGSGRFAAHWLGTFPFLIRITQTGDNKSTWQDLIYSISGILSMQLFGITMVGPDTCGFEEKTNEELCRRWTQLAAFYPFARNHNSILEPSQEPYVFGAAFAAMTKEVLLERNSLHPYWYTLFAEAHHSGKAVARPMFYEFATDQTTWPLDHQYMVGPGLLIAPQLEEGGTTVHTYLPNTTWYDWRSGHSMQVGWVELPSPTDSIPVLLRGGVIIPTQEPASTIHATRMNPLGLTIALNSTGMAEGWMYCDDGISLDDTLYDAVGFVVEKGILSVQPFASPKLCGGLAFDEARIYGAGKVTTLVVNGKVWSSWEHDGVVLRVWSLNQAFGQVWTMQWRVY